MESMDQTEDEVRSEPLLKFCFIMRGIPGSGKSTVAKKLKGEDGVIHSADALFLNENGDYVFNRNKLKFNHEQNFDDFKSSIKNGQEKVIVDNTNITEREYKRYAEYAQEHGYIVSYVVMPHIPAKVAAERNLHQCSEEIIVNMLRKWKKF